MNLKGKESALQQNSTDTLKVWWIPVLARGKLHLDVLPHDFPGECPEAAEAFVDKVAAIVNVRFPNEAKPRVVMSDRGGAFYHGNGRVTPEYSAALRKHGFRAFAGDDASIQPGTLQELMLHETAVSWTRHRLALTLPTKPWLETREEFAKRVHSVCRSINAECRVGRLCSAFPKRIDMLIAREGDRIKT